jgi:uncharacterized protein YndB with AHSA1/START domain
MEFVNWIIIDRPRSDVFSFVADLENTPRWNHAIAESIRITNGPIRVGTTYRQVRVLPRRVVEEVEITDFQPDRRLQLRGAVGPLEGTITYDLEDLDGRTRLVNTMDLSARGVGKLVASIAATRARDAVGKNLLVLRGLLEATR